MRKWLAKQLRRVADWLDPTSVTASMTVPHTFTIVWGGDVDRRLNDRKEPN